MVDTKPPAIWLACSAWGNCRGWYNSPVTFSYRATAAWGVPLAGPSSGSYTFSNEGANQSHVFTVSDVAGNTASVSTGRVNIDLTPPTSVTASAVLAISWSHGAQFDVTVSGVITDALSGAGRSNYTVFAPDGDVVGCGTFTPDDDGSYSFKVTIRTGHGPTGPYTIVVGGADGAGNVTLATTTINPPADLKPGQRGGPGLHG